MKSPVWKNLLSYVTEWHIESAPSDINPHLYVSLKNGRYQLSTANAVYSYGDLYANFAKSFATLQPKLKNNMNVLILGFGLGSIPYMLEKKMGFNMYYTGIEIDENVIYLADKYVLDELKSPVQLICTDAGAFVAQTEELFDLICMDVFLDDVVPYQFRQIDFLEQLKERLNLGGLLLFNRLALLPHDREKAQWFFDEKFKQVFPKGEKLDVGGNWMMIGEGR